MPDKFSMAGILFCMICGSSRVDVIAWISGDHAKIRCSHCGKTGDLCGFTVGRCYTASRDSVQEAYDDQALPRRGTA